MRADVIVLGTADWNQPIATNQHYVSREIAAEHDVLFVESMGLRRPQLRRSDMRRMAARLSPGRATSVSLRAVPDNLRVVSPRTVPLHRGPAATWNRRYLRRLLEGTSPTRNLLWTYTPVTYGVEDVTGAAVYHCVDLLGTVPGIDPRLVEEHERRLARKGVRAVASSQVVADHLRQVGFVHVEHWPNVADVERVAAERPPSEDRGLGAVFAGNLTWSKIDFDLLERVVRSGTPLQLAGPISEGGGQSTRQAVAKLESLGACYHGHLAFEELARLYWRCRVGLIPYRLNDYTRGVSPLKTFEYLAAGLAVTSSALPGVWPDGVDVAVAQDASSFVGLVSDLAASPPGAVDVTRRFATAQTHGWGGRGVEVRRLVAAAVAGAHA